MILQTEGGLYRISKAGYKRMLKSLATSNDNDSSYTCCPSEFGGTYLGYAVNIQDMTAEDAVNALKDLQ